MCNCKYTHQLRSFFQLYAHTVEVAQATVAINIQTLVHLRNMYWREAELYMVDAFSSHHLLFLLPMPLMREKGLVV